MSKPTLRDALSVYNTATRKWPDILGVDIDKEVGVVDITAKAKEKNAGSSSLFDEKISMGLKLDPTAGNSLAVRFIKNCDAAFRYYQTHKAPDALVSIMNIPRREINHMDAANLQQTKVARMIAEMVKAEMLAMYPAEQDGSALSFLENVAPSLVMFDATHFPPVYEVTAEAVGSLVNMCYIVDDDKDILKDALLKFDEDTANNATYNSYFLMNPPTPTMLIGAASTVRPPWFDLQLRDASTDVRNRAFISVDTRIANVFARLRTITVPDKKTALSYYIFAGIATFMLSKWFAELAPYFRFSPVMLRELRSISRINHRLKFLLRPNLISTLQILINDFVAAASVLIPLADDALDADKLPLDTSGMSDYIYLLANGRKTKIVAQSPYYMLDPLLMFETVTQRQRLVVQDVNDMIAKIKKAGERLQSDKDDVAKFIAETAHELDFTIADEPEPMNMLDNDTMADIIHGMIPGNLPADSGMQLALLQSLLSGAYWGVYSSASSNENLKNKNVRAYSHFEIIE